MIEALQVQVSTKPFDNFVLYKNKKFDILPGVTSLVGCNGSGKSTFIEHFLIPYLNKHDIEHIDWNDRQKGGYTLMDKFLNFDNNIEGLAAMALSSEGERIVHGISEVLPKIGHKVRNSGGKPLVVTFDAIDSGMSVDEIIEIRDLCFDVILPDAEKYGTLLFIVIAANNYEWCNDPRIHNINITTGNPIEIKSYDDFKDAILKSRATKDRSRKDYYGDED